MFSAALFIPLPRPCFDVQGLILFGRIALSPTRPHRTLQVKLWRLCTGILLDPTDPILLSFFTRRHCNCRR